MPAALWAPLMAEMPDFRLLAVDLPGHGLSDAFNYRGCDLRRHAGDLLGGILDELQLTSADFIGSSLGAQLPLWLAVDNPHRLHRLVAFGDPAVAFRGPRARGALGFLSIPGVGRAMLQTPIPLFAYKVLLSQAAGKAALRRVPREVVEYAHLAGRRPGSAGTVASLMRRVNRFRWPRAENVLSDEELSRIEQPVVFIWGEHDLYLSPSAAAPSVARIPHAELHVLPAGHFPWLDDPARSASAARRCLVEANSS